MPVLPLVASRMVLSRVELAGALAVEDHVQRRTVLHGAAGIARFVLCENLDAGRFRAEARKKTSGVLPIWLRMVCRENDVSLWSRADAMQDTSRLYPSLPGIG